MSATTVEPKFFVVIGTSAGGIKALEELVTQLTPNMDAALFIVLPLSRKGIGKYLYQRLQEGTSLQCKLGVNEEPINKKRYLHCAAWRSRNFCRSAFDCKGCRESLGLSF